MRNENNAIYQTLSNFEKAGFGYLPGTFTKTITPPRIIFPDGRALTTSEIEKMFNENPGNEKILDALTYSDYIGKLSDSERSDRYSRN